MVSFEEIPMTVQAAKAIITQVLLGCEAERRMGPNVAMSWAERSETEPRWERDRSKIEVGQDRRERERTRKTITTSQRCSSKFGYDHVEVRMLVKQGGIETQLTIARK